MYFDDLTVRIDASNIVEESHYYAYGLKIAGISSRKISDTYDGDIKNNNLYNDKELWDEADLNWYDYGFRNYDPQIGRFVQLDPLTDEYPLLTPYQYANNDPIANIDVDGLETGGTVKGVINGGVVTERSLIDAVTVVGKGAKKVASTASKGSSFFSVTGSFFKGLGQNLINGVKSVGNIIAHPVQTAKAIGNAIVHPVETAKAIKNTVVNTYQAFKEGDANKRAEILGNLTGELLQALVGAGAVKAVSKVSKLAKITKVEKIIDKAAGVEKSH